jgi:trimeric autotransporter adhesin
VKVDLYRTAFGVCLFAAALTAGSAQAQVAQYVITTVAGNNTVGYSGDGGQATAAQLSNPADVATDKSGNLYIADQNNSRIRKVSGGVISTVAGSGTSGYTGDTGASTSADISSPYGVVVDSSGNIYFSQPYPEIDAAVREAAASGDMSSIVGAGNTTGAGFAGDGLAAATYGLVNTPLGLAVDGSGNLYIADSLNNRIRVINSPGSGNINTVAGNGVAQYTGDGGLAVRASLNNPEEVAVDGAGNLYIADTDNHCIRKVSANVITTVAGVCTVSGFSGDNGPAIKAHLFYPKGIAVDASGDLFIADTFNSRIRLVTPDGNIHTIAGHSYGYSGDGGLATAAEFRFPLSIALGPNGVIYVSDTGNNVIRELIPVGTPGFTVNPPTITNVISASACGAASAAAPGSFIEIYGSNLAADTRNSNSSDFNGNIAPTSLDGTQVSIAGQSAVLSYISPRQVNAQVPLGVGLGSQSVAVTTADATSLPYSLTINAVQPGLCQGFSVNSNSYVIAVIGNNPPIYVLPAAASFNGVTSRPAHPGEVVMMFGNGFGPVTPSPVQGQLVQQLNQLNTPFQIYFGPTQATVQYAGLAPGFIGLYQFNVVVPDIPASDTVPISFNLGTFAGANLTCSATGVCVPDLFTAVGP